MQQGMRMLLLVNVQYIVNLAVEVCCLLDLPVSD